MYRSLLLTVISVVVLMISDATAQLSFSELQKRKEEKMKPKPLPSRTNQRTGAPEQDCKDAIVVCKKRYIQPAPHNGIGDEQEVPANSCLGHLEKNSVWYIFTVQVSGTLEFVISPDNIDDDYDFALYDLTGRSCSDIPTGLAPEVRCNFCVDPGDIGLSSTGMNASEDCCLNFPGCQFSSMLDVTTGQTYALIISNYGSTQPGQTPLGYTLTFGGSAKIIDDFPPEPTSAEAICGEGTLIVHMSEEVLCDHISADGSEFEITGPNGPHNITGVSIANCRKTTTQIEINFTPPISTDQDHKLRIKRGTDNNGLLDRCGNELKSGSIVFNVTPPIPAVSGPTSICKGSKTNLTASGGTSYLWNTGEKSPTIAIVPNSENTYYVTVTQGSCNASATYSFTLKDAPVAAFNVNPRPAYIDQPLQFTNTSKLLKSCGGTGSDPCDADIDCNEANCLTHTTKLFWNFGDGSTVEGIYEPVHTFINPGIYNISLLIVDQTVGCSSEHTISLTVQGDGSSLFIPSAISPNGDGVNDILNVLGGSDLKKLDLKVYNRSGKKIFETSDPFDGWDGTYNGKMVELGVYVYAVEAEFTDGQKVKKKGNVTLVK